MYGPLQSNVVASPFTQSRLVVHSNDKSCQSTTNCLPGERPVDSTSALQGYLQTGKNATLLEMRSSHQEELALVLLHPSRQRMGRVRSHFFRHERRQRNVELVRGCRLFGTDSHSQLVAPSAPFHAGRSPHLATHHAQDSFMLVHRVDEARWHAWTPGVQRVTLVKRVVDRLIRRH